MNNLSDKSAIVGIGETAYTRGSGVSSLSLLLQASLTAIKDAGLSPHDIDAIVPPPMGPTAEDIAVNLGITKLALTHTIRMGGASAVASLQSAVMAVTSGIANCVLSVTGGNRYSSMKSGGSEDWTEKRSFPMQANVVDYEYPFGCIAPTQWNALMARRHMHEYGTTPGQMGAVAVAMRKHAMLNDNALMKKPVSLDDYFNSRIISEPFRLLDCCIESDGAAAVVITSAERAHDLSGQPIYISGVGEGHPSPPDQLINRHSITELGVKHAASKAFAMADMTPEDIDIAEIYDCFTYTLICQLEDIGFCKKGEGGPFVDNGRIELDGDLPVNTHGGLLSQAHVIGMNHVIEAVKQLRGVGGRAQVQSVEVALVSGFGDLGDGSVAIMRR